MYIYIYIRIGDLFYSVWIYRYIWGSTYPLSNFPPPYMNLYVSKTGGSRWYTIKKILEQIFCCKNKLLQSEQNCIKRPNVPI